MISTLSIGEILWDVFPDKKVWGGAPANFIYHSVQFGAHGIVFSAVGNDQLGKELIEIASERGLELIADTVVYPTGLVNIKLNADGIPSYTFNENCAWDHIPFTPDLQNVATHADLISFGTLAQRNDVSRQTILSVLESRKKSAKVLFDINLRQDFYSKELIESSLSHTDFLKLNEDEVIVIQKLTGKSLKELIKIFNLELAILTLGPEGSDIITSSEKFHCHATKCTVVDTVGAGDSFTACFIMNYLNGVEIKIAQQMASNVAAFVCEHNGATIPIPERFKRL